MARKRRKAPKILLHPMFQWIRGKMGKIVYRLTSNGYDMTVSDYFQGNDLLWQKLHGDQQKPDDWCW